MTVWTIMVFMLIIPEANIFHEKNDLEFCFYYWFHTVVLYQQALNSSQWNLSCISNLGLNKPKIMSSVSYNGG